MANNTIIASCARYAGGGIYISGDNNGAGPIIQHNVLKACYAAWTGSGKGGAIYCEDSSPTISGNTITSDEVWGPCSAEGSGGGIYVTGGDDVVITRNMILGCTADTAGGGIYCDSSSARISDNVIQGNACPNGSGGGIYVTCESDETDIVNNTLTGNTASTGGGIYVADGSPNIVNNIVASNSQGIWWPTGATPSISHNDVWGNTWGNYPAGEEPSATYHNISRNPGFLSDGYHIDTESPCVGAGDSDNLPQGEADIDGQERVYPENGHVDVGADETLSEVVFCLSADTGTVHVCSDPANLTVVCFYDTGAPYESIQVDLETDLGQFANGLKTQSVTTDSSGTATAALSPGSDAGLATITATAPSLGLSREARIELEDPRPRVLDVLACGSDRIAIYWADIPEATDFEVYRSTTPGGQNYSGQPIETTVYYSPIINDDMLSYLLFYGVVPPSSLIVYCVDTGADLPNGLEEAQEYFYTVKAVYDCGESDPSDETSDIPDAGAIPWDTYDAEQIIPAFVASTGVDADVIRVMAPDGIIYDSRYGGLYPDGYALDDVNFLTWTGEIVPLTTDGGEYAEEPENMQAESLDPTPVNATDGPIRRVRTEAIFKGAEGSFFCPDDVYRAHKPGSPTEYFRECFYQYLGCHQGRYDIDAGIIHTVQRGGTWRPYLCMSRNGKREQAPPETGGWVSIPLRFGMLDEYSPYFVKEGWVAARFTLERTGATRTSLGVLSLAGLDNQLGFVVVAWGAPWPEKKNGIYVDPDPLPFATAMMKRCESLAQGELEGKSGVKATGSHMYDAAWDNGQLLRPGSSTWEDWGGDDSVNESQGTFPSAGWPWVWWDDNQAHTVPFKKESGICIHAGSKYPQ